MNYRAVIVLAAGLPLISAGSLPEQSAALVLERAFPDPDISYLLLDVARARLICSRWANPEQPVPVGSLVKPFTALAYGETHAFRFPESICQGEKDRCWLPAGHGALSLAGAIAHSCNAYFLRLAAQVKPEALAAVAERFGLTPPDRSADTPAFIGIGDDWPIAPLAVARAYCELTARTTEPGVREILAGLALSARAGTGHGVGPGAYAKTGTAPCVHPARHRGDGYAIALFPAESPRLALLVRVHGVPGAEAAMVCGHMRVLVGAAK